MRCDPGYPIAIPHIVAHPVVAEAGISEGVSEAGPQRAQRGRIQPGLDAPLGEHPLREGVGFRIDASGYLSNFREAVRDMSTGGVLLPPSC